MLFLKSMKSSLVIFCFVVAIDGMHNALLIVHKIPLHYQQLIGATSIDLPVDYMYFILDVSRRLAEYTVRTKTHLSELPKQMRALSLVAQEVYDRRKNQHVRASSCLFGADWRRVRRTQVHDGTRLR